MNATIRATAACALLSLLAAPGAAQDWLRFRGPNGSGVGAAPGVPAQWTAAHVRWKAALPGPGHSSPVVCGQRVFVTAGDEKTGLRTALCFDSEDGRLLWQRAFGSVKHRKHDDNSFASATPAADDERIYLTWANPQEYLVVALDHEGREVWRTDLGPYRAGHGFGASPIVHDGALVVPNDQDGASALVAFEGRSGKKLWQLPRKSRASYSTPCLYHPPQGPAQLIVTSYEQGVTSVDPATGKVNWQLDVFDKGHVEAAIGSPVVAGDVILAGCGWLGVRHEVVALRGQDPARLYCLDRSAPLCTTPLVHEGLIYLWSDRGIVSCAELATGEVHWRERVPGSYYSSPIAWVGHIANVSREGDVVVLAAGKRFTQLAANPVGAGSHSTPAIAGGRIFVRTFTELLCVGPR